MSIMAYSVKKNVGHHRIEGAPLCIACGYYFNGDPKEGCRCAVPELPKVVTA